MKLGGGIVSFIVKGGHVGFVVGQDKKGNLMVLGGNQSCRNIKFISHFSSGNGIKKYSI